MKILFFNHRPTDTPFILLYFWLCCPSMCRGVQRSSGILFYIKILKTLFLLKYCQILYQWITCPRKPCILQIVLVPFFGPFFFSVFSSQASTVRMPLSGKDRKIPRQKDSDLLSEVAFVQVLYVDQDGH